MGASFSCKVINSIVKVAVTVISISFLYIFICDIYIILFHKAQACIMILSEEF